MVHGRKKGELAFIPRVQALYFHMLINSRYPRVFIEFIDIILNDILYDIIAILNCTLRVVVGSMMGLG